MWREATARNRYQQVFIPSDTSSECCVTRTIRADETHIARIWSGGRIHIACRWFEEWQSVFHDVAAVCCHSCSFTPTQGFLVATTAASTAGFPRKKWLQ